MTLKASDYSIDSPIYTWIADDGTNIHIDTRLLREWTLAMQPPLAMIPIERSIARAYIEKNVVSSSRVLELLRRTDQFDPLIFCRFTFALPSGTNGFHVDGHHRYVVAALSGLASVPAFVLEEPKWRTFEIHGLPSLSQDELLSRPNLPRNY